MKALGLKRFEAVGLRGCLYAWAITHRPGGIIERELVATACEWDGDEGKLFDALKTAKLVDVREDGAVTIHDWPMFTSGYRKAKKDAKRKKAAYEKARKARELSTEKARSIRGDSSDSRGERNGTERNRTERSGEGEPSRADALPPSHAALAPLQELLPEPEPVNGLLRAFAFCQMPGLACKRKCINDLKRQGVDEDRIMHAAHDPMNRNLDFFDIMKSLKPERAAKSEWDKAMEILRDRELRRAK